jgi:hypothetical protein
MGSRLDLQSMLETLLGTRHVYFQPPSTLTMVYPCIVYSLARIEADHGNNMPYTQRKKYTVTVIDRDPDSAIPGKVARLESAAHKSHFVANNPNHDVFDLYF